jgi:hypothetical protein
MTQAIGVEVDCPFTPAMLRKIVYAGSQSASFVQATKNLESLAELKVSRERVQRWTKRIGQERSAEAESASEAYQQLLLPEQRQSPQGQIPQVACVQMDGGRIQIRDRKNTRTDDDPKGHWRETLVGCCLSMTSVEQAEDPCPTIPQTFVDPQRMSTLGREIKGFSSDSVNSPESSEKAYEDRPGHPKPLVRSVLAARQGVDSFGKRLVAAAYARGFHAACRKAFVADGSATNWGVHAKHFSHYTAILDFTHAICYVYAAAMAGRSAEEGWRDYCQWAQWLWSGRTPELIAAVASRSEAIGPLDKDESETSPRTLVAKTLVYLKNQQGRMQYAEYRKQGLPITSSHIESTIKQINRRVKGTEKFWDQGATPLLQLAADHLSETREFGCFWQNRAKRLQSTRHHQNAA